MIKIISDIWQLLLGIILTIIGYNYFNKRYNTESEVKDAKKKINHYSPAIIANIANTIMGWRKRN